MNYSGRLGSISEYRSAGLQYPNLSEKRRAYSRGEACQLHSLINELIFQSRKSEIGLKRFEKERYMKIAVDVKKYRKFTGKPKGLCFFTLNKKYMNKCLYPSFSDYYSDEYSTVM
jgi:hypothetical protein